MSTKDLSVSAITAFIPAWDYELSRSFYQELGFAEAYYSGDKTLFQIIDIGFWLQNYYVEEWANNTMLCLYVEDIKDWWQRVENVRTSEKFAGVLWHIRQSL